MGDSLQDQLLKAGLVDKDRLERQRKEKKRQQRAKKSHRSAAKARPRQPPLTPEQQAKAAHDRELEQQRSEVRRQREIAAEVRQLVRNHRHPRPERDDDVAFNFENKGRIKRLFVSAETHRLISSGRLVIVNDNGVFELVPPAIAERIRRRNPSLVIDLPAEKSVDPDDPYAAYQVPDDLMW